MKLKSKSKIVSCPNCGFTFSIDYARVFACRGCPTASLGCDYVKCPKCGYEFTM